MADAGEKRRSSADRKIHDGTKKGKKGGDRSDELVGKKDGKPTTAPGDLAGTLQTLFTQTEATDGPTLKPLRRPKLVYENTFRLWPYKPFNTDNVRLVLNITLEEMLSKAKYKVETASDLLGKVCEKVRARVLSFKFDRYKIIVLGQIGPLHRQGIHIGMKCLWDPLRDSYVSHVYKNAYVYCNCCVYGIYFE